ncbi:hypothetical protein J1N35_044331 [Gossypium stocksii]|uniref:Reverse transcriptase domain-containing protein n=1 Tax=Gossypium stocksii TaxID=47602 RepID=A0A9D3U922_9ROSI|nr:hypothetical protein J1N35_044331 [Gossypium stocksii]
MMEQLGFLQIWVDIMMKCVLTIFYYVSINWMVGEFFQPFRGLWQGDPLSPFLLLICSERLSSLMRLAVKEGLTKGAKVSRSRPQTSHLLLADGCVLLGEALERAVHVIKQILE